MEQNFEQEEELTPNFEPGLNLIDKILLQFNKRKFLHMLKIVKEEQKQMFQFVNHQNQIRVNQFLSSDKFNCDQNVSSIKLDKQGQPLGIKFQNLIIKNGNNQKLKRKPHQRTSCSHHVKRTQTKKDKQGTRNELDNFQSTLVPLWDQQSNISDVTNQDEFIGMFRQRRTKRQLYKTKLLQNSQLKRKATRKIIPKTKPEPDQKKKDKFRFCQHFVDMDFSIQENDLSTKEEKENKSVGNIKHQSSLKKTQSLTTSPKKSEGQGKVKRESFFFTARNWQPLVQQQRQLILPHPENMKLASGVSLKLPNHKASLTNIPYSHLTRKRLQFLKNSELDPVKIKLNELLSYKRLGTSNQLAYCSSLRTVKSSKSNFESNPSIQSNKLLTQTQNEKNLIKIANKKIYDELVMQEKEISDYMKRSRNKMKIKKQVKVRFDS